LTVILALDLGTKTGWAEFDSDFGTTSGVQNFAQGKFAGGGQRFLAFARWLVEFKPTQVYFEAVRRHIGTDAAHIYGGMLAILTSHCEAAQIPYLGVPVGTIKKHATGRGNAKKPEMIAAMVAKGHAPKDDNEADALALLYYALEQK
jgi:crossover junction endodeoxyribonuclease RuvC